MPRSSIAIARISRMRCGLTMCRTWHHRHTLRYYHPCSSEVMRFGRIGLFVSYDNCWMPWPSKFVWNADTSSERTGQIRISKSSGQDQYHTSKKSAHVAGSPLITMQTCTLALHVYFMLLLEALRFRGSVILPFCLSVSLSETATTLTKKSHRPVELKSWQAGIQQAEAWRIAALCESVRQEASFSDVLLFLNSEHDEDRPSSRATRWAYRIIHLLALAAWCHPSCPPVRYTYA